MQQRQLDSQRGQTLPFWAVGTLVVLSLLFFTANYLNVVAWQIRAQNAADSAASVALSVQANNFNEISTLLYAAALDENRLRYLNQALLNTIYGVGGCNPSPGGTCDQNYQTLLSEYDVALNGYTADIQLMGQANNLSQGGQRTDTRKAIAALGTSCAISDCAFTYTLIDTSTYPSNGGNGNGDGHGDDSHHSLLTPQRVDVVACRNVPYFVPLLLKLGAGASFQALGRAADAVIPANSEVFDPGTAINPQTGQPYQPPEPQWAQAYSAPAYTVDFSALQVNLNWYSAGSIAPYDGSISQGNGDGEYQCS